MIYIYESHMGGLYADEEYLDYDYRHCDQCGDTDEEIGNFNSLKEFLEYYADNIDCDDGNGGYDIDEYFNDFLAWFDDDMTKEEAIKIIQSNRKPWVEEQEW